MITARTRSGRVVASRSATMAPRRVRHHDNRLVDAAAWRHASIAATCSSGPQPTDGRGDAPNPIGNNETVLVAKPIV